MVLYIIWYAVATDSYAFLVLPHPQSSACLQPSNQQTLPLEIDGCTLTIVCAGNEGYGLRTNIRRSCTSMVKVELGCPPGNVAGVESLNVSVATGVLLHQLLTAAKTPSSQH